MLRKETPWTLLDKDMSGPAKEQVFLWYLRGEGRAVLTDLKVAHGRRGGKGAFVDTLTCTVLAMETWERKEAAQRNRAFCQDRFNLFPSRSHPSRSRWRRMRRTGRTNTP